jgi:hypothetical protein
MEADHPRSDRGAQARGGGGHRAGLAAIAERRKFSALLKVLRAGLM